MAEYNTCGKICSFIFIVVNTLLSLIGAGAISVGAYVVHIGRTQSGGTSAIAGGSIIIVAGVFVLLIIAFAVYGAMTCSRIILFIYIFIVGVIIVLQVVAAVVGFVYRGKIITLTGEYYIKDINKYRQQNAKDYDKVTNRLIDTLQNDGKCCGWYTYSDWNSTEYFKQSNEYPRSCVCKKSEANCIYMKQTSQYIYNTSCKDSIANKLNLRKNLAIIAGIAVAIAAIQIVPLVLAMFLMCAVNKEYRTV